MGGWFRGCAHLVGPVLAVPYPACVDYIMPAVYFVLVLAVECDEELIVVAERFAQPTQFIGGEFRFIRENDRVFLEYYMNDARPFRYTLFPVSHPVR